ncbi:hypothetical protein EG329_012930 [Mollisiaceae sp. DMI_Dod_QoI]|nr:hypothetical protein EG329_012930 [Helotiales sp. DMI_Dod_QoI]
MFSLSQVILFLALFLPSIFSAPLPNIESNVGVNGHMSGIPISSRSPELALDIEEREASPSVPHTIVGGDPSLDLGPIEDKREALPEASNTGVSGHMGGFGLHHRTVDVEEREASNTGVTGSPSFEFGLTEEKREASPEASNTGVSGHMGGFGLHHRTIDVEEREASNTGVTGSPSLEFGLTEEKREASPEASNTGVSGHMGGFGLHHRTVDVEEREASNTGVTGSPSFDFSITEEKREASNTVGIIGSPSFGLTRGS